MNDKTEYKIKAAMDSLEGISPAEPKPFFMTRLNAALQNRNVQTVWSQIAGYIKNPAVAGFSILLLLVVNIAVFSSRNFPGKENIAKRSSSAALKYDFAINVSGVYDTENQEP